MADSLIRLYKPCNVLLCLKCGAGIKPGDKAVSHFRKQHKVKGEELQRVVAFIASTRFVSDPVAAELPQDGSIAIDGLKRLRGFSCTSCRFLTINRDNIVAHQRKEHNIHGTGWRVVTLQSFGQNRHTRYWTVQRAEDDGDDDDYGVSSYDGLARSLRACEDMLSKEAEDRWKSIGGEHEGLNTSRWVKYMKWKHHLRGVDRGLARAAGTAVLSPAEEGKEFNRARVAENKRLRLLAESFDRELRRSARRIDRVPTQTLKWLQSVDAAKPVGEPFCVKEMEKTWEFYSSRFQRYLCYCARVWALGRKGARREHRVRFTDKQWQGLDVVVRCLDVVAEKQCKGLLPEAEAGDDNRDTDMVALDRAVFAFCIDSLQQKIRKKVYDSPLLHFTAVLAIGPTSRLWVPAHSFTRSLAGILWCSRVLLLEQSFAPYDNVGKEDDDDGTTLVDSSCPDGGTEGYDSGSESGDDSSGDSRGDSSGDSSDSDEEVAGEAIDNFARIHREWLCDGAYAPISSVIEWMAYGRGFRRQELGMPRLAWEGGGRALNFEGERIRVEDFRHAAQAAAEEAEALLDGLLGGQWSQVRSAIELDEIRDSLVYEGPGRSFATNGRNGWLRPGASRMAELVGTGTFRIVSTGGGQVMYESRRQAAEEFILKLKRFKRSLLAAVHIWAGQPGRGPEMTTLKHCDTDELPRNVMVFDGLVVLITDHDKQRKGRRVARWLPADLSLMMVAYVAWLIPFEQVLHRLSGIRGPADTLQPWLWKDASRGLWKTDDLSRQLDVLTSRHVGVRLTVASYRHVAIELGRQIKGLVVRLAEMDATGGSDECEEWTDPNTGELRQQPLVDYIWDLQATHGSRIATSHYALSVLHPDQLQPEMLMNYKLVSELWHGFLQGRADGGKRGRGASEHPHVPAAKRARMDRQRAADRQTDGGVSRVSTSEDIDAGLKKLFGAEAQWKTERQREIMERIVGLQDNGVRSDLLIVVLPTGGGKSIFFMLSAVLGGDDGSRAGPTSVVVVPFAALIRDMEARAREMGIDCLWWRTGEHTDGTERQRDARLVLVSADVAVSAGFMAYVQSIRSRDRLGRIFFDECHTSITDVGYRARLGRLKDMHRLGCPMVMLTATLPVAMESWYREKMLCRDAAILRSAAVKLNVRYTVKHVDARGGGVREAVLGEMRRLEEQMTGSQKGMVYCRSIAACEQVGEAAGCGTYHSRAAEDANKMALKAWIGGQEGERWIVATSGLGTGIDIGGIVAVIHMQEPHGLVDFVQQTGRGGRRAGEVVESVIVTDERPTRSDEFDDDIAQENRKVMRDFMQETGCRRIVLGKFMDGCGRSCSELEAEKCDNCSAEEMDDQVPEDEMSTRLHDSRREIGSGKAALEGWLDRVAGPGRCSVCYVRWHMNGRKERWRALHAHDRSSCSHLGAQELGSWRRGLRFSEYRCCYSCALPFDWCERGRDGGRCTYGDKVVPVLMMVGRSNILRSKVEREFGVDAADRRVYQDWLMRSRQVHDEDMTNGLAVWDYIVRKICVE